MTNEVTPDAPTICTLTGQDMTWNGQRWVHAEPHNFCAIHDTIGESPLSEPQARLVGFGEYTIRELQERSHQQSRDKGFHDYQPTDLREIAALNAERVALFHSEASEMLEEQRKGHAPTHTYYSTNVKRIHPDGTLASETITYYAEQEYDSRGYPTRKPEGQGAEAADMIIRVMDWAGANGVDLQAAIIEKLDYNATRAKMHGGKKF